MKPDSLGLNLCLFVFFPVTSCISLRYFLNPTEALFKSVWILPFKFLLWSFKIKGIIIHFSSFKDFFYVDHFKSLYWICYSTVFVLWFTFLPRGMWDLSSPIRDWTYNTALEGEVLTMDHPALINLSHLRNYLVISFKSKILHIEPPNQHHHS